MRESFDKTRLKAPMKVMHIISNLNDGGAEGALYRLCLNLPNHKHIVVSMLDEGKYGPLLEVAGVSLHCLHMSRGKASIAGVWCLWRLLRDHRPDAVQTWMYHADLLGGVLARLSGVRKVCWGVRHSNLSVGTVKRSTIGVAKACSIMSSWVPSRIISCSHQAAHAHAMIGYDKSRLTVIPNGYDLTRFRSNVLARETVRKEWGFKADTFVMGMVARFDKQKDHMNLIAALGRLKSADVPFQCVLVGTDMVDTNSLLVQWIRQEGLENQVRLLGRRDDIPAVMSALDMHVLSSLGEAFPNVLAEAMACGTPCVTTDVGDAALILGETGWLVPSQDSVALADAMMKAFEVRTYQPEKWAAVQAAGLKQIDQKFRIEQMCIAYQDVWCGE